MILEKFDIQAKRVELSEKSSVLEKEKLAIEDSLTKVRHKLALIKRAHNVLNGMEEMVNSEKSSVQ